MNCSLDFMYHTVRPAGTAIAPHQHHCFELVYYLTGLGSTRIRETPFPIRAGRYALIHPHTLHDERHEADCEVLFIGFTLPDSAMYLPEGVFDDPGGCGSPLYDLLSRLKDEMAGQQPYRSERLNLLAGLAVIEHARRFGAPVRANGAAERLHYARRYMDEHFQTKVNLEYLADLCGYSYDRFRHLFKETVGVPPLQYLQARRLEHACHLLRRTDLPLGRVAEQSGFGGAAAFSSLFHRTFSVPPKEYRRRYT